MSTSVYLHIPFCRARCDYCAFATWTDRRHLQAAYLDACRREYERARRDLGSPEGVGAASTLFVGGGTPSLVAREELAGLIGAVDLDPDAEVTVEANPEDVTEGWAEAMAGAGVNRVSLGVQSLDPAVLDSLGRRHGTQAGTVAAAARAIAGAGIRRFSVDLIYGAAGESDASWRATLEGALGLEPAPSHVSAYALTVEAGTPLAADRRRHPDDDVQADRYEAADELLAAHGLEWYEISNWARSREECRHNLTYWRGGDYRGIGCAAHSHREGRRWWNLRTPERYTAAIEAGRSATAVAEELSPAERAFERLELSLRTREGVPPDAFGDALDELVHNGLVSLEAVAPGDGRGGAAPARAVLTLRGRLLANEVACALADGPGGEHQMQRNSPRPRHVPLSSSA